MQGEPNITQPARAVQTWVTQDAPVASASQGEAPKRIAVFCVGNKLYLDDGAGPAVYEEVLARYDIPENVQLHDVGCMSMDMIGAVNENDLVITVDAVEVPGAKPGQVFRYSPSDMARVSQMRTSLHDLRLADLFDAAALLGYSAQGVCLGIQVQNRNPVEFVMGLTPPVYDALPLLIDTLLAELARAGAPLIDKDTKEPVTSAAQGVQAKGGWSGSQAANAAACAAEGTVADAAASKSAAAEGAGDAKAAAATGAKVTAPASTAVVQE